MTAALMPLAIGMMSGLIVAVCVPDRSLRDWRPWTLMLALICAVEFGRYLGCRP